jgi:hypothetical protein
MILDSPALLWSRLSLTLTLKGFTMMAATNDPVAFFYENAGYGYNPSFETEEQGRQRGAESLAKAEQWAKDEELEYVWVDDPHISEDYFEFEADKQHVREHGAVGCILYRPCPDHGTDCKHAEQLASLWGITESLDNRERDAYRRVVEAELALEAMPE